MLTTTPPTAKRPPPWTETPSYLKRHLFRPRLMLHRYGDAILAVANGTSTAETALAQSKANET